MRKEHARISDVVASSEIRFRPKLALALQDINATLFLEAVKTVYQLQIVEHSHASEWIPMTVQTIYDLTGLSRFQQQRAIRKLEQSHILQVKVFGMPGTRHVRIDYKKLAQYIDNVLIHHNSNICGQ
ncbi:MAG: hypothetical protein WCW16_03070 [Candidatus Magasanikbacteria bacterium]